jgi:hypothetical protein
VGILVLGAVMPAGRWARAAGPEPAQEPPITPYVRRGMLYGAGQAGLSVEGRAEHVAGHPSAVVASLGIAFGLTSRLSLEGSLGSLTLAPQLRYRRPAAALWVGLVDTPLLEVDAALRLTFGPGEGRFLQELEQSVVAVIRPGDALRIDAGVSLPTALAADGAIGLRAPVQVAVQINPYLHAAIASGLTVSALGRTPAAVPLGLTLGCTVPLEGGGYAMVAPSLTWPHFASGEAAGLGTFVLGVAIALVTPS